MKKITVLFFAVVVLGGLFFIGAISATGAVDIQRGGTLRVTGAPLERIDHPARYSWIAQSNWTRHIAEYLTFTDENNVTHPWLLERWEASEDLMTWTLYLRKGIKWNNGDDFTADDVVFTMKEWLDPEVGSSILGLMAYLRPENIEKVDDYTVRLQLDSPQIAVPEHLYHYPAQVMNHRTFEGDFLKAPVGTGPFVLEEFVPGERVVLRRRTDPPYWRMGTDGKPLPYLDKIIYLDLGMEASAHIAAILGGEVDVISEPATGVFIALRDDPNLHVIGTPTASTRVLRMRVDKEPWDDWRVRLALKLCQDREKILKMAHYGEGVVGQDHHVAPIHPAYYEVETPAYDPERAKALLAEAGYPDGLSVDLHVATDVVDAVSYAEILKEDAAPAGFDIRIKTMPITAYWDIWTECDLGITPWAHRPLATIVLGLAYIADEGGKPVPWNETRWVDDEFSALLKEAEGTLDVEERREIMGKLQRIQMERGSICIAYWMNVWAIANVKVQNFKGHPTTYDLFTDIWIKQP